MGRRLVLMCLAMLSLAGCSSVPGMGGGSSNALLGLLTSQLGVTETQAAGGVGSYLALAQEKLTKGDFDQVAALVPGASKYIDQARSLGAIAGPIGNLAGLNSSLGKLGISPETAAKFTPAVTDYLGKAGGSSVQNALAGMLQ